MTRTERATSPRALMKDRSESRSGMDKSFRKDGAGMHNWGSLKDEYNLEREAFDDEGFEEEELQSTEAPNAATQVSVDGPETVPTKSDPQAIQRSEQDVEQARAFRAKALKGELDLSEIARTSAGVSTSP